MSASIDIPLHDIMPLVEVHEPSIYWFSVLVIGVLVIFATSMLWFSKLKRNKTINERRLHYDALQNIDLKNSKQSAYRISKVGYFFAHDNEQTAEVYQNLFTRLEPYKYSKNVEKIDEETLRDYYRYLEMIKA